MSKEEKKKLLAAIVSGAVRPFSRLHKAKVVASPTRSHCDSREEETEEQTAAGAAAAWTEAAAAASRER